MLTFMLCKKCPEKFNVISALINQILKRRNAGMKDRVEVEISTVCIFYNIFIIFSKLIIFLNYVCVCVHISLHKAYIYIFFSSMVFSKLCSQELDISKYYINECYASDWSNEFKKP